MPHILIVEDDATIARLMQDVLVVDGADVRVCADGAEGIQAFKDKPADLVLQDVNVPSADGFEVVKAIRDFEPPDRRATIVMLTGNHDLASKLLAFSVGADDYLIKPIDIRELRSRVARWLDRRAQQADLVLRRRREAIQEIVAAICHEVNNPLTVALMGLDLVLGRRGLDAEMVEELETARDHLVRIGGVLGALQMAGDRTVPYLGKNQMIDLKSPVR